MVLRDILNSVQTRLAPPGDNPATDRSLRPALFGFFAIHTLIAIFYSEYHLASAQDYNALHYYDAYKHPEWWTHDITDGAFGGLSLIYLISITSWLPVAIHATTGIPLEWLYWLEFLVKPSLLIYLLYRIVRDHTDAPWLDYAPLFMVAVFNFRVLGANLSSYQSNLYINYYAATYLLLFLYSYWMLCRNRRMPLAISALLGPFIHPSLGLLGSGLLVALAWGRKRPIQTIALLAGAAGIGLAGELTLVRTIVSGHETIPEALTWQSLTSNGHLYFPFLFPIRFAKVVVFTGMLVVAATRLTGSKVLRRDVWIAAAYVALTIPFYFVSAWIEFKPGIQLAPMRSSVLLTLIAVVCLASRSKDVSTNLIDHLIFASLPVALIYLAAGRIEAVLAFAVCLIVSLVMALPFKKVVTWGLACLFLGGPVWLTRNTVLANDGEVQLHRFVNENFEPGTNFLTWGKYSAPFRTITQCQLITPSPGHGIYWNLKSILDDELIKAGHTLGRVVPPDQLYTLDTYRALSSAQTSPITLNQVRLFTETHATRYLIYPTTIAAPTQTWVPLYENHEYRLYDLETPENPQLPPN